MENSGEKSKQQRRVEETFPCLICQIAYQGLIISKPVMKNMSLTIRTSNAKKEINKFGSSVLGVI